MTKNKSIFYTRVYSINSTTKTYIDGFTSCSETYDKCVKRTSSIADDIKCGRYKKWGGKRQAWVEHQYKHGNTVHVKMMIDVDYTFDIDTKEIA